MMQPQKRKGGFGYANCSRSLGSMSQNIWGQSWDSNMASLRVFMVTLRKKLEPTPDSPQYIQTHIGVGYRMVRVE